MPPSVSQLLFTDAVTEKLGARAISTDEALETLQNERVIGENPAGKASGRRFLFGRTSGGRYLTFVIEPTLDPTTWLVVTGWESTPAQRKILGR